MRNLAEYPITKAEKQEALRAAVRRAEAELRAPDPPVGGVTLAALQALLEDLEAE